MFLSTFENKLDKKGRVSVPAHFRSHLSNLGFNSIVCFPSFNQNCIEAWPQDRIEKISTAIDNLNPFEEKKDFFSTSILSESINLIFDTEGRILLTNKLLNHSKIKNKILFVGLGKIFQIWNPDLFEKFRATARKKSNLNRASLKWEKI
tara:strand:- start:1043 stop:1489 length:447 start_codon:yes stop_codon:yes gene_type:complete